MSESLVSVLIPAYNHEKFIKETIYSVVNQSYQDIELIIVDDGSCDKTLEIINGLKEICLKRFRKFNVYSQSNKGTCQTLNRLLDLSSGDFVLFLASDDILIRNAIELEIEKISQNMDLGLVVGINSIIDENGVDCFWDNKLNNVYTKQEAKWFTFTQYILEATKTDFNSPSFGSYKQLLECNHVPNGCLIRRSVFTKIGRFTDEAPLEDYWLMLQIAKFYKFKFISEQTFKYRWHSNNSIKNTFKIQKMTLQTLDYEIKNFLSFYFKNDVLPSYKEYCYNSICNLMSDMHNLQRKYNECNCSKERILNNFNELKIRSNILEDYLNALNEVSGIKLIFKLKKWLFNLLHKCFSKNDYLNNETTKINSIFLKIKRYKDIFRK